MQFSDKNDLLVHRKVPKIHYFVHFSSYYELFRTKIELTNEIYGYFLLIQRGKHKIFCVTRVDAAAIEN